MARSPSRFAVSACCLLAMSLSFEGRLAAQERPTLELLMSRLTAYLAEYEGKLSSVVAHEHYDQQYQSTSLGRRLSSARRTLDSEFLFLRPPGYQSWLGVRDVMVVDGMPVRVEAERLVRSLASGTETAVAEARRVSEDNARYNLGDTPRTINVPTLALDFLAQRSRSRLRFRRGAAEPVEGRSAWRLDFTEIGKPTIIQTRQGTNQRVRGFVWIDPGTGTVLKTALHLGDDDPAEDYVRTSISVRYAVVSTLDFLVPMEMWDSYYRPSRGDGYSYQISAHAVYSNFRRFEVGGRVLP